ncbi:hypothetical protein BT93_F3008 [Corymbia citriodora subsp. variegata]|nr:hypothetical protein BT93_F3008 [Corymbia citriodora subsp. variegata]
MGECKEKKINQKTPEMSKEATSRNVSSISTVFPAPRSSSGYTYILQSQSGSVDSRSKTVMKSIGRSTLEKSTSCLPAGCKRHAPLPSLARHQRALFPSKTANLKQDRSCMMENVEDENETESIEEGESVPDKSRDASVKSSMNAHDVMWHGNEKSCVLQGQSPFDGSKSSSVMNNMTRRSGREKCLLTRRDFPPGCGSRARVKDLIGEFIPYKSCDPSFKSSTIEHVFKWRRNKDHADNEGVGAREAGSKSQGKFQTSSRSTTDKVFLRKEDVLYNHRDIVNESNRDPQIINKETEKSVKCSVDSRSKTMMKSIRQSALEKSMSCLPAGCRSHAPLPSLAQRQQLFPSKTANLKQDHSGMMEDVEDEDETESIEEGENDPDKSPDASVKSSINAHDVIWHGNEKSCVLQGQSPFDGSKSSILMNNRTRDPRPEKCLLTRRDFPPGCGNHARVKGLIGEFIPDKSCESSIKSSATEHVFKWRRNIDHADSQGVGAKEAGSQSQVKFQTSSVITVKKYLRQENFLYHQYDNANGSNRDTQVIIKEVKKSIQCSLGASPIMKDKGSKRKSFHRCDIWKCLEESTLDSSESLHAVPKSDIGRANPSFSELRNVNVTCNDIHDSARKRVITTLRLYRDVCRELSREKSKAGNKSTCIRRIDFHAAKEIKKRVGYVHGAMQFIGDVPGVKVGDKFYYRMELAVVGLHRPPQNGIDYMGPHPNILATSVVASWDYADDLTNPEELVYLGQGGMPSHDKKAEDQKLSRGNLALLNSMKRNEPVRVIRKDRDNTFTYDGLYLVDRCRKIRKANRQMVFEFLMKRLPGQPETHQKKKMKVLELSG